MLDVDSHDKTLRVLKRNLIASRLLALGDQIGLQVARERAQLLGDDLITADQVVVEQHGRNGDRQTEGGHDQRFIYRSGDLVYLCLTGNADADKYVQKTQNKAEQTDERRDRADRS